MGALTKATRRLVALWSVLAVLWFLFLPQWLAAPQPKHRSAPGAVLWAVVLVLLLSAAVLTWRRYRKEERPH